MIHDYSRWYAFLKGYVNIIHNRFYKNIYVSGLENIPVGKPVIFGPNHQNALMDPLAVLLTTPLQPVFLARADIFKSAIARPILRFLKILPVYRVRDGLKSLENNDDTFNESISVLEGKKQLALFPEARHHGQYFLLPLKKGIPRIALLADHKHKFNLDLQIVPVGIHYSNYFNYQSDLWINFGKPISVDAFKEAFEINPQQSHLLLRDKIADGIKPLILNIEDKEHYDEIKLILELYDTLQNSIKRSTYLSQMQTCVQTINNSTGKKKTDLLKNASKAVELLNINNLPLDSFSNSFRIKAKDVLELIVGLPVFLIGFAASFIYLIAPWFLYRNLKDRQFESSYKFIFQLLLSPVSYGLLAFLIIPWIIYSNIWISIVSFVALFFIGSYALNYRNKLICFFKRIKTSAKRKRIESHILALKKEIDSFFEQAD